MTSESERIDRAGDYIMGRMSEAEKERAERDLERDPEFRETVIRLAERLRASTPVHRHEAEVWNSIQETIAGLPQMRDAAIARPQPARTPGAREAGSAAVLGGWRGAAAIAALAAAAGAGFVAGGWMAAAADPVAFVRLKGADGTTAGILEIAGDDMLRFLPLDMRPPDESQVLLLWTTFDEAVGPVRLGSLSLSGSLRWRGPALPRPQAGQAYAIMSVSSADAARGRPVGEALYEGTAEPVPHPD